MPMAAIQSDEPVPLSGIWGLFWDRSHGRGLHPPFFVCDTHSSTQRTRFLHLFLPGSFSALSSPRSPDQDQDWSCPGQLSLKNSLPSSQNPCQPSQNPLQPSQNPPQPSQPSPNPSQPSQPRGQGTAGLARRHLTNLLPQVPFPARDFSDFSRLVYEQTTLFGNRGAKPTERLLFFIIVVFMHRVTRGCRGGVGRAGLEAGE